MFDEEDAKESRKHLSLSLESTFHHCCLEKETDVELVHRDLSTALLVQLLGQKGLLDKSQTDVIEEDNSGKTNPKQAKNDQYLQNNSNRLWPCSPLLSHKYQNYERIMI